MTATRGVPTTAPCVAGIIKVGGIPRAVRRPAHSLESLKSRCRGSLEVRPIAAFFWRAMLTPTLGEDSGGSLPGDPPAPPVVLAPQSAAVVSVRLTSSGVGGPDSSSTAIGMPSAIQAGS